MLYLSGAVGLVGWSELRSVVCHGSCWTSPWFVCGSILDVMCWTALWFVVLDARLWFDLGIRCSVEFSLRFNFGRFHFLGKMALSSLRCYSGFLGGLFVNCGFFASGGVRGCW